VLSGIAEWAQEVLLEGGYPMLFALILLENLAPPIPSEVILPLAGFSVSQGTFSFVLALVAATLGSVVGALLLYAAGRYGGRPALDRWGRYIGLKPARIQRADRWFDRYAEPVVFFGRLIPGVRSIVSVPAGLSEMPLARFLLFTTLGSGLWNTALIGAGWAFGERWEEAAGVVAAVTPYALAAVALGLVALAARAWSRRARPSEQS